MSLVLDAQLPEEVQVFLNRLSDYLFVASRFAALRCGATEQVYKKARGITQRALGDTVGEGTRRGGDGGGDDAVRPQ